MGNNIDLERQAFRSSKFRGVVRDAVEFFSETPVHEIPPAARFAGSGVYGLYYAGGFTEYARISEMNTDSFVQPIYIGKAIPRGWRTARVTGNQGQTLRARLNQHGRNIVQAVNLSVENFKCRFMLLGGLETELIGVVEAQLIRHCGPLWNVVIDGFGNHDPGRGSYNQAKSEWDVLHPGRLWANRLTGTTPSRDAVIMKVRQRLAQL